MSKTFCSICRKEKTKCKCVKKQPKAKSVGPKETKDSIPNETK